MLRLAFLLLMVGKSAGYHYHRSVLERIRRQRKERAGGGTGAEVSVPVYTKPGSPRSYVAEITGVGGKYGLYRDFKQPHRSSRSGSGKTGNDHFKLEHGKTYEVAEPYKDKRYVKVNNGNLEPVPKPSRPESNKTSPETPTRGAAPSVSTTDSGKFTNASGVPFTAAHWRGEDFTVGIPSEKVKGAFFSLYTDGNLHGTINGNSAIIRLKPEAAARLRRMKKPNA